MKKAVVTEALGFIGFQLCSRLLEEGIEVAAVDDLKKGSEGAEKENKLNYFGRNALFTFYNGEIAKVSLRKVFEGADVCFDLSPQDSCGEKEFHHALHNIFENIRIFVDNVSEKEPFFILDSSTDLYGKASGKVDESAELAPVSSPGLVSLVKESLFSHHGLPLAVLRFPEIYGPGQPSTGSLHRLISGETPDHEPADVLYIEDAVSALIAAAEKSTPGTFNIASGKIGEWSRAREHVTGENLASKKIDRNETSFSIEKAKETFGFIPEKPLKEGIEEQKRQVADR
ncbi:MAG TPA: NAD-dependent epimerase/dehydratase family protein [Bacillales bacterium]